MARKRTTTEEDRARIQEEQEARALKALGTPHRAGAHEGWHYIPAVDGYKSEQHLGGE